MGDKNVNFVLGTWARLTELCCPRVHVCVCAHARIRGCTSGAGRWWVEGCVRTDRRAQGEEQEISPLSTSEGTWERGFIILFVLRVG